MTWLWGWAVFAVRFELALYRSLARWLTRRPDVPAGSTAHPYVGAVAVLLWAFVGGSALELVVLHLVIPWEGVRLAADILGIWGLLWMLGLLASMHVYPHLVTGSGLVLRSGHSVRLEVPWADVASVGVRERSHERSRTLQVEEGAGVLSVVVASRTNLDLRLRRPVVQHVGGVEHRLTEIRVFADDPRAMAGAVRAALTAERARPPRPQSRAVEGGAPYTSGM